MSDTREMRAAEEQAKIIGVAVIYAAAAAQGATEPPEVTDEQALSATTAVMSMLARADIVVTVDPRKAFVLRMLTELASGAFKAGEAAAGGEGAEAVQADATVN